MYTVRVLGSIFAEMSGESWQILGNIVNTAGVTGFAITGATTVLAGYQTYVSPYASLAESERKLDKVQSRLQELTPQQREEIDARSRASGSKGLTVLEKELIKYVLLNDAVSFQIQTHGWVSSLRYKFYRLSMGCDEMSFMERHIPFSQLRERVRQLVNHSRALFKDTLVKFLIVLLPSKSHYVHCASGDHSATRR